MIPRRWRFLVAFVLSAGVVWGTMQAIGLPQSWSTLWQIPVMQPYFADARVIALGAEAEDWGIDPFQPMSIDPWGRSFNYPRIWLGLRALGVNGESTMVLGLVFIGLFAVGLLVYMRDVDWWLSACVLVALYSPAVMLGLERGNNDLAIFGLLAVAAAVMPRAVYAGVGLIAVAFVLKLYPLVAGLAVLAPERRPTWIRAGVLAAIAAVYLLVIRHDLALIRGGTPSGDVLSYGCHVLADAVLGADRVMGWRRLALQAGAALALAVVAVLALRRARRADDAVTTERADHLAGFRIGAAVYVGTFVLGANWDYRLVFLLLTLPWLWARLRAEDRGLRWLARTALVAIFYSLWSMWIFRLCGLVGLPAKLPFLLDEAANWLAFLSLGAGLALSLPRWLVAPVLRRPATPQPEVAA